MAAAVQEGGWDPVVLAGVTAELEERGVAAKVIACLRHASSLYEGVFREFAGMNQPAAAIALGNLLVGNLKGVEAGARMFDMTADVFINRLRSIVELSDIDLDCAQFTLAWRDLQPTSEQPSEMLLVWLNDVPRVAPREWIETFTASSELIVSWRAWTARMNADYLLLNMTTDRFLEKYRGESLDDRVPPFAAMRDWLRDGRQLGTGEAFIDSVVFQTPTSAESEGDGAVEEQAELNVEPSDSLVVAEQPSNLGRTIAERLRILGELRDSGLIDDDEFATRRAMVLDEI